MKKYIKTYCDYFNYGEQDYIPSELSGSPAQSVHHICFRSRLGKDNIENLMALTQEEHFEAHGGQYTEKFLQDVHNKFLKNFNENNTSIASQ